MTIGIEKPNLWDSAFAKMLPGQMVLVGLTYFAENSEEPSALEQFFGRVVAVDKRMGILLSLEGQRAGEQFILRQIPVRFRKRRLANIGYGLRKR